MICKKILEWIDRIKANTASELLEGISVFDENVRIGFSVIMNVYYGLHVRYGGYRKEMHEFRDAFGFMPDFDVTFYKHEVYIRDEKRDAGYLELFSACYDKCDKGETVVYTVGELRQVLKKICKDRAEEILILSPDNNFGLKGAITKGICLEYMDESDSAGQWLILEVGV